MKAFLKQLMADLKNSDWPAGTTTKEKNKYRWKVVGLMAGMAVLCVVVGWPWMAIVPGCVAVWKVKIILTDK